MIDQQQSNDNQQQLATKQTASERLQEIVKQLTIAQLRFCVARQECSTDREACEMIGITHSACRSWDNKKLVDEAAVLMAQDGLITALEIRRRSLAEAMAVKRSGLLSKDEKIRQAAATEIIEWELGKAVARNETRMSGSINLIWDIPAPTTE